MWLRWGIRGIVVGAILVIVIPFAYVVVSYIQVGRSIESARTVWREDVPDYGYTDAARIRIVSGLGGPRSAAWKLRLYMAVSHESRFSKMYPLFVLGGCGEYGVETLERYLSGPELDMRVMAVDSLTAIGPRAHEAVPVLHRLATESDWSVRCSAIAALISVTGDTSRLSVLTSAIGEGDCPHKMAAIHALARLGPVAKTAIPALLSALSDKKVGVDAVTALGSMGPVAAEAIPILEEFSKNQPRWSGEVNEALRKIRQEELPSRPAGL